MPIPCTDSIRAELAAKRASRFSVYARLVKAAASAGGELSPGDIKAFCSVLEELPRTVDQAERDIADLIELDRLAASAADMPNALENLEIAKKVEQEAKQTFQRRREMLESDKRQVIRSALGPNGNDIERWAREGAQIDSDEKTYSVDTGKMVSARQLQFDTADSARRASDVTRARVAGIIAVPDEPVRKPKKQSESPE